MLDFVTDRNVSGKEKKLLVKGRCYKMSFSEYNDYINTTRRWLSNYNRFKVSIKNMSDDIDEQKRILAISSDMGAAVAKYGDSPGGGTPELYPVEMSADMRIKRQERIRQLMINLSEVRRVIEKIDLSIDALSDEEAALVRGHYIDGESWWQIAQRNHYSESWARKKTGKALKHLSLMIFGTKAVPEQIHFVFAD